ncbi:hypothetical protein SYNPS1DRAFT_24806 [Syncephalis pseudoplumigaleata]|uniref:Fe2OG dioxygenase domain-containing protein n=1 Tax=Syncephalis pseudoplumigaleata TaxID=1712513 RepID=A0A4P9YUX0_9FUNG|nr:hypothetical protein SYNPS1DRAFT_24806 [Syncephalis pseudoplumigaleata]|eukprot:RKP23202.1 hypothetical protein SYNPS1DRAFT_24806 [Syncephalis pseudoplumigaleata]
MAPHAEDKTEKPSQQEVRTKIHRNKARKGAHHIGNSLAHTRFGNGWLVGVIVVAAIASLFSAPFFNSGLRYAARSFLELHDDPAVKQEHTSMEQTNATVAQPSQGLTADYVCKHGYSIRILNQDPLVLYLKDFLQEGEAEHIMALAEPHLYRSPVGHQNGYSEHRTSYTASLQRAQTSIIRCVEERAAHFVDTPLDSVEMLQVIRYEAGQQYKIHRDYITEDILETDYWGQYGQRYASFLVYLQEPEGGGNTTFFDVGLSIPPRKNDGIFWLNVTPEGLEDKRTNHAGEPILAGQKWAINIWPHKWTEHFRQTFRWKGWASNQPAPTRYYATDNAAPTYT